MLRHIPLPAFKSAKRSRLLTIAVTGTLTAAAAVSAATILTAPIASPAASASTEAFLTVPGSTQTAVAAAPSGAVQHNLFMKLQSVESGRQQKPAAASASAADHKAAVARAAKASEAAKTAKAQTAAKAAVAATAAKAAPQQKAATARSGSPRQIAKQMLSEFGWEPSQFSYLDKLWWHESGWSATAENPASGAFGIPQALPASQMASAGADWRTNPATQIKWGLTYIQQRYGSPSGAWAHEQSRNWY